MTVRYGLVLGLLAALAVGGYLAQQQALEGHDDLGATINLSGRQRMLSQRIAFMAERLVNQKDEGAREALRREIVEAADLMERSHRRLASGGEGVPAPASVSLALVSLYEGPPPNLDAQVGEFLAAARRLAAAPSEEIGEDHPDLRSLVMAAAGPLLRIIDATVKEYETYDRRRLAAVGHWQMAILILTLLVLAASAIGVFLPMATRVRTAQAALLNAHDELRRRMEDTQARLTDALESMTDGLALLDAEDRFVMCNSSYRRLVGEGVAPLLVPGTPFTDIVRAVAQNGMYGDPEGGIEAAIEKRLAHHRSRTPHRAHCAGGRWVDVTEYPTHDGGTLIFVADVTSRRQAEEALRRSEARLAKAQRIGRMGNWDWDLESNRVVWSEETFRIFGLDAKAREPSYEMFIETVHADDRPAVFAAVERALRGEAPFRADFRVRRPDGEERHIRAEAEVEFGSDGRPRRMIGINHDVTELRVHERELLAANRALVALSRCNEALIRAEDETRLLAEVCRIIVGDAGYRMAWAGYAEDDREKTVRPVAWFGDRAGYLGEIQITWGEGPTGAGPTGTAIRSGEPQVVRAIASDPRFEPWRARALARGFRSSIALPFVVEGGPKGSLNIYAGEDDAFDTAEVRMLENLVGNVAYGISMLRVRADRQRVEQALRERDERYRTLVEMAPNAIFIERDGLVIYANPAAARLLGAGGPTGLLGRRMADLVHPDHRDAAAERTRQVLAGRATAAPAELAMLRLDGATVEVEALSGYIVLDGTPAIQSVVRDITERKRVQAHLIQTTKLATLGEMAAGITHELNQPLNIIRLAAEGALLRMDKGRLDAAKSRQALETVRDQAGRMADIIGHMRVFSRRDEGEWVPVDPGKAVRDAVALVADQWSHDHIAIELDVPPASRPVLGRPVQLEQVIVNLLTNAHDAILAAPRQGTVPEPAGRVHIALADGDDGQIRIAIRDTGGGIPESIRERIFEPFFTTKEAGAGTGLGLSISYGIVTAMGGELKVRNVEGGAEFGIVLPAAKDGSGVAAGRDRTDEAVVEGSRPAHVLIVDDEPLAAQQMGDHLAFCGHRVTVAGDGDEAFRKFAADRADLVITDLRMPRGDGAELIRRLRARDTRVPIIIATGHLNPEAEIAPLGPDPAVVILRKPVRFADLDATVESLLAAAPRA